MEVKEMKLSNYNMSLWDQNIKGRHIRLDENWSGAKKVLCGLILYCRDQNLDRFLLERKFNYKKEVCPTCFSHLPENLQEELKFNYIVRKLKNEI